MRGVAEINIKKELVKNDFIIMEDLEKLYYDEDYITKAEESYRWYIHSSNSIVVIEHNGEIVGFMNMFPIKDEIFNKIKNGEYNDKFMTYKDVVLLDEREELIHNLFLSCIVIHEKYRGGEALKILLQEYLRIYEQYVSRGFKFNNVITDNVTENGVKFSKKIGLKPIIESDHGSTICMGRYEELLTTVKKLIG